DAPDETAHVRRVDLPDITTLLYVVVAVVVVAGLYLAKDVLVPIVLAVLLAFILAPLVALLRRLRFGRTPSVVIAILLALGVIGSTGAIVGTQVGHLAGNVPSYVRTIEQKAVQFRTTAIGRLPQTFGKISQQFDGDKSRKVVRRPSAAAPLPVEVHQPPASPFQTLRTLAAPMVGPLETTVIVLVVAVFVLMQQEDLRDRLIRLFGSSDLHRTTIALNEAGARLSRFFLTQLIINATFGAVIGVGLYFIGVPSPALWGIIAGLLRFVPYIGAFLAAVPPLLLGAAVDPGWTMVISTAVMFAVAEPTMGYVVEPLVYGHSTGLSPVAVIVAAIFWTWLWGPIGLLLSTPLTLCMVVLGRHVERLQFLDVIFGDRPALTPVESFYQRMLAGDGEEVEDQAEMLLKERSLSAYYDEVVIPGLRMAAADRRRGVLSLTRLGELAEAAEALADDLSDYDDVDPTPDEGEALAEPVGEPHVRRPPAKLPGSLEHMMEQHFPSDWATEGKVLCLAGPGRINEAVATILAQLLRKHGAGATTQPPADAAAPRVVCLVFLEITRSRRGLREFEQETRERFPDSQLALGLWRTPIVRTGDEGTVQELNFSSLREAIGLCLEAAGAKPH
ncbi:MAG: AI-2E family transporter, partial [Sphingomonadales bacterium]